MDIENKAINLLINSNETKTADLIIKENIEGDEDTIILEIEY